MQIKIPGHYIGKALLWLIFLAGAAYAIAAISQSATATIIALTLSGAGLVGGLVAGAFILGSWWTGKQMERGAEIALRAQVSDDDRDRQLIQGLTGYGREVAKQVSAGRSPQALGPGGGRPEVEYPALLPYTEFEEIPIVRPGEEAGEEGDQWMQ